MKLTRRDFIKTAGAATGTMAISSVIPMPAWARRPKWRSDSDGSALGRGIRGSKRWQSGFLKRRVA